MSRPRVFALVIVAVAVAASCSSSKPKVDVRQAWDPAAVAQLKTLRAQFARGLPGECKKMNVVGAAAELEGIRKVGDTVSPAAMGTCTILEEPEEIAVFDDAKTRDTWVEERARLFCAASQRKDIGLPGLHWVTGGTWSLLADSEGVGRRIARATGTSYRGTPCPGGLLDWNPDAVGKAQDLADKLSAARLGCADFTFADLDQERRDPQFSRIGMPAAFGKCTLRGTNANEASFAVTGPGSVSLKKLVDTTSSVQCPTLPASAIVVGPDWAVFTPRDVVASRVAHVIGGTVHLCPQ